MRRGIVAPMVFLTLLGGSFGATNAQNQSESKTVQAGAQRKEANAAPAVDFEVLARQFDYDLKQPLDTSNTVVEKRNGVTIHDIQYASPKGGRVTAYLVVPQRKGPFAPIVFGHWGLGTRTEFLPEAMFYARAGAICLLVDYPWVRPAPWRRRVNNYDKPELDREAYTQAVVDLRRGIDLLLTREDADAKRLAYVGHSYGAQWGAILSAVDKRIKAAVLIAGVPELAPILLNSQDPDLVEFRKQAPAGQIEKYIEVNSPLDAIRYVGHAAPTALLFQFANYERYFDKDSMGRYFHAASKPKKLLWYDTGHEVNDPQALADRYAWLREQVGLEVKPLL